MKDQMDHREKYPQTGRRGNKKQKIKLEKGQLHGETKMTREGRLIKRKELAKILGHPARITMNSELSP
jgi:hypothetical protein